MDNLFAFLGKEPLITIFLLFATYAWVEFIAKNIKKRNWFSEKYINTMYWIFGFVFFFAFLGGTLETLEYEFRLALQDPGPGGLWFGFIPFFIGTLIAGTAITILITYLVRLTIPFFKKIHEKANK